MRRNIWHPLGREIENLQRKKLTDKQVLGFMEELLPLEAGARRAAEKECGETAERYGA